MSLIKQFWQTATTSTLEDEDMGITATIDGKVKVVFEASIRRHLKLEDSDGISTLSTVEIFEQLALMGSKNTAWEQFSSNIATAIICLATNRTFNFSKLIFEAMVKNLDSKTKFLMYPIFIQIFLNKHKRLLLPHKRIYIAPTLTQKLFSNMKRASKGYTGMDTPLFQTMLVQGQTLQGEGPTIPVESHHTPTSSPSTSQPTTSSPSMPATHVAKEAALMPHDSPIARVHSPGSGEGSLTLNELMTYGTAYTKLIIKVKKLEHKVKAIKARRKVGLVISDDEDDLEDPSKQGRKIAQIDEDEGITLVQMGAQTQGRSDEDIMCVTSVYDYPEGFIGPSISITIVELVTTCGEGVSTARAIPEEVSTIEPDMDVTLTEALVDLLKSGKKKSQKPKARGISFQDPEEVVRREVISPPVSKIFAKDKGKAIMTEPEKPLKKKDQIQSDEELALRLHAQEQAKFKRLQKERAAQEEASRAVIYEEMDNIQAMIEAERKRFFAAQREVEQMSKPPTKTQIRNRMCTYLKNMGRYKHNQLKGKSYEDIQKPFDKTYKHVNSFVPMASNDKEKGSEKKAGGSRKKTFAKKRAGKKQSKESSKRQKMEDDAEKEEVRAYLDIILGDDVAISVESLATRYPIVDWKTHVLSEDKMQDVLDLYRLVKERFETASPEGYDTLLWGDLITVFEPSKDDEVWKAQQDYTLISWRLFDSCGIHVLLMDTDIDIHMLVEKTYPLTQEMLSRTLSGKLEVDNESEMAFELLRFIRS
ncbi:hypothetical protein Tco_1355103 [Tanacetum coccineum]